MAGRGLSNRAFCPPQARVYLTLVHVHMYFNPTSIASCHGEAYLSTLTLEPTLHSYDLSISTSCLFLGILGVSAGLHTEQESIAILVYDPTSANHLQSTTSKLFATHSEYRWYIAITRLSTRTGVGTRTTVQSTANATQPANMLKNLRRNSKQLITSRRKSVASIPEPAAPTSPPTGDGKLTFFSLPAELRNDIYTAIARSTRILVPLPSTKPKAKKPPPTTTPALLLVSKQVRQEYTPLLLLHASIAFQVKGWDFRHLAALISSLYSSELKALRLNAGLVVRLWQDRLDGEGVDRLRRWLVHRAQGLDRLALEYEVVWGRYTQLIPTSTQVQKVNSFMQRRLLLGQNLGAMGESFLVLVLSFWGVFLDFAFCRFAGFFFCLPSFLAFFLF